MPLKTEASIPALDKTNLIHLAIELVDPGLLDLTNKLNNFSGPALVDFEDGPSGMIKT